MWSFYYLKNETVFEEAMKDILIRGGDTDTNAAIIGGLIGAA
jgi:ADP-ribosylglycohydrolase